jgi:hypothetical protein
METIDSRQQEEDHDNEERRQNLSALEELEENSLDEHDSLMK